MNEQNSKPSAPLPQSPSGLAGRMFGFVMEWFNTSACMSARSLSPSKGERFLKIGFGTDGFARLLLDRTKQTFVAGLDPSGR